MVALHLWRRRESAPPPLFFEPTPYCDRLTLAESFAEDTETRPNAEDRRREHKPIGGCVEAIVEGLASPRPAHRRR